VLGRVGANFGPPAGARLAIASDLPRSAGMSSSSVLMIAAFLALRELNRLREHPAYTGNIHCDEDLAAYLACIENGQSFRGLAGERGVGTFGGSEDHTAILCCRPGELALYRFCPAACEGFLPLPDGWVFAIGSSGVIADKGGSAREKYNRASRAAAAVLQVWREATGRDDPTLFAAATSSPPGEIFGALRRARHPEFSGGELMDRFDQFCRESLHIIPAAAEALRRDDLEIFGLLVEESQSAAELLLRNQVPETIHLARSARQVGAAAASAFGAGFGGAVWSLIRTDDAVDLLRSWRDAYAAAFPARASQAQFFLTSAGPAVVQIS
jgi:galactokinase